MNIEIRTVLKMAAYGLAIFAATWMLSWGSGTEWLAAVKSAVLATGTWLIGQLQRTGEMTVTLDGLKKEPK